MKTFKTFLAFMLCISLTFGGTSCMVVYKKDNGKKGWHKNPNNPHHPNTTNPGHTKSPEPTKGKPKKKSPKY